MNDKVKNVNSNDKNSVNKCVNNSGLNKFLGRETRSSLIDTCVEEFLEYLDSLDKRLTPKEIERKLTTQLCDEIKAHNSATNDRWSPFTELPPNMLAKVINHVENVALISFVPGASDDTCLLGIYRESGERKGVWETDTNAISEIINQYAPLMESKKIEEVIKKLRRMAKKLNVNREPHLCAVKNGIYNRLTHELEPFRPEYVTISKLGTAYNPDAENVFITMPDGEVWDCLWQIESLSDDEDIVELLKDVMCAAVYPYHRWDKAVLPYSTKGNNGKGTFAAMIRAMLGDGNHTSISIKDFSKEFYTSLLITCPAVITDENAVGVFIDACDVFKALITHDAVVINRKFQSLVSLKWYGFILECINELPRFQDKSESALRRFLIIPFEKCFTGVERKYIKEDYLQRQDVREFYLKMALERDAQELVPTESCKRALEDFKECNNPAYEFVKTEMMTYDTWEVYPLAFAYQHYKAWYEENIGNNQFLKERKFKQEVVDIIKSLDSDYFLEVGLEQKTLPAHALEDIEPNILKWKLEKYMAPTYHGSDPAKTTNFKRPENCRGYVVINPKYLAKNKADV